MLSKTFRLVLLAYGWTELNSCTPRRLTKASVSTEPKSIAQRTIVKIFRFFLSLFILKGTLSNGQIPKTEPLLCAYRFSYCFLDAADISSVLLTAFVLSFLMSVKKKLHS